MTTDQPERSRRGFIWKVAAAFLTLILLIGAGIVAMSYVRDDNRAAPALPQPADASATEPAPRDAVDPSTSSVGGSGGETAGACDLPVGDQSIPVEPPDTRWELVNGAGLPISDKFGPHATAGEARVCYPRNPTGALFAAANILPGLYSTKDVRDNQVTSGPMREQLNRDVASRGNESSNTIIIVGYRIDQHSKSSVNLTLVAESESSYLAVPTKVVWADGDWKVDGSDVNGQLPYEVTSLQGFQAWGGQT